MLEMQQEVYDKHMKEQRRMLAKNRPDMFTEDGNIRYQQRDKVF